MTELQLRILTGTGLLVFAVAWLFWMPEPFFVGILALIGLLASEELLRMLSMPRRLLFLTVAVMAWLGLFLAVPVAVALLWVMILWSLLTLVLVTEAKALPDAMTRLAWAQWMMGWLILFAWSLVDMHGRNHGLWLVAGTCAGVWVADIAAYFTGKRWGKHKLCPAISPGKTIEGIVGGLIGGTLAAMTVWLWGLNAPWWTALPLAVLLVCCAILGDLNESALKRAVGVKDSGRILPGHGGFLDRMDALLPAIPMVAALSPWCLGV
ncbi:MAG: phosphatidate cytidylyltransferase [Mariprofundaceae bacterium]|nr:phosphatidate cytidylyltransferase [Mariprofundaceae bacterium]